MSIYKVHQKKLKRTIPFTRRKSFWLSVIIISALLFFSLWLIFSPIFQINSVDIEINKKGPANRDRAIRLMISKIIKKNEEEKANLIGLRIKNIFLFNSSKTEREILNNIPEIENITIHKKLPHSIVVQAQKREAIVLWSPINDNRYFLMDKNGIIFREGSSSETSTLNQPNQLVVIKTQGKFKKIGQSILTENKIASLLKLKNKIEDITKTKIKDIILKTPNYLVVELKPGWSIYINPQNDINWQMIELGSVLEKKIPSSKRNLLKYIDLRFNKIFISPNFNN